jgi:malonyl-CoA O-methyltransferase
MNEKPFIKRDFSKAAEKYNQNAFLQKQVATELCEIIDVEIKKQNQILDLGSGTGFIAKEIGTEYNITQLDIAMQMCKLSAKHAPIICADIEWLPIQDNSFDGVVSSLAFQWLENLKHTFAEISGILRYNGYLIFATLTHGTLKELKHIVEKFGKSERVNNFHSEDEIRVALEEAGFEVEYVQNSEKILHYDDAYDLMRNIKVIGAGSKNKDVPNLTVSEFELVNSEYKNHFSQDDRIYSTWNVQYFVCRKV